MPMSNYLANKLLDHSLGTTTYTKPTTVYLALYTATPSASGGGTEISGNGYARIATAFGAASAQASINSGTITFTASGGNWGTVTSWGIFDASTAGNLLHFGSLSASKTINNGDSLSFTSGNINISGVVS